MKRQSNSELRILLVRLREIGDVVFTTPAVRALRKHYPDAHISYIVEPHAAPVVRDNPQPTFGWAERCAPNGSTWRSIFTAVRARPF